MTPSLARSFHNMVVDYELLCQIIEREIVDSLGPEGAWKEWAKRHPEEFAPFPDEAPALVLAFCYVQGSWSWGIDDCSPSPLPLYSRRKEEINDLLPMLALEKTQFLAFDEDCWPLLWSRSLSCQENPGWSFSPWASMRDVVLIDRPLAERLSGKDKVSLFLHEQLHSAIDSWVSPEDDLLSLSLARAFDEKLIGWILEEAECPLPGASLSRKREEADYLLHLDSELLEAEDDAECVQVLNRESGLRRSAAWWDKTLRA